MLREYKKLLDGLHIAATGCLIVAVYVVLHWLMRDRPAPLRPLHEYLPAIGIFTSVVLFSLYQRKFSTLNPLTMPVSLLRELGFCYTFGLLGYVFAAYTFKMPHLSRMYMFGSMAWSFLIALAWHTAAYAFYSWMHSRGWNIKRALLAGDSVSLTEVERTIRENSALGLRIGGILNMETAGDRETSSDAIGRMLGSTVVDCAIFTAYRQNPALTERLMLACQERGIEIWLKPDFIHQEVVFSRIDYLHDIPMFVFSLCPREGAAILFKRLIDILAAGVLLMIAAVPMLIIAMLIRWTSRGPALFSQPRIGLNGRKFLMYKFRSMYEGTQNDKIARQLQNEHKGPVFKMAADPRITPVGRILRKYSLDELPQLLNVLTGNMSLVGPRPPLPEEVSRYEGWQRRRLSMRPGITGLWQVGGRNSLADFNDWVKLDLDYIDDWSLWLDLKILFMTIPAVIRGTGV
ncbi:MAG: sugar transferase [bacterium]